jgi:aryl-alcohol dehydrogenase-like predicted oxidoreductase
LEKITFGRSGLDATRCGFGALPIQRVTEYEAVKILRAAYDGGINFFDTARGYTNSERRLGLAFEGIRGRVVIASKSAAEDAAGYEADLKESLRQLRTDHIDIHQFHFAKKCHRPEDPDGLYNAALKAKAAGKIRFIGLTAHRLEVAMEAAKSGLYDTIQFPLSYLSAPGDFELVKACEENGAGLIAMKALSGGLITDAKIAWLFMRQFKSVIPVWGIQKQAELEEFLRYEKKHPVWSDSLRAKMERDKAELSGNFCRGCGYCLPCPASIELNWVARMPQAIRRMPVSAFFTDEWLEKMERVKDCVHCGACKSRCPYELDTPKLIAEAYEDYHKYAEELKQAC